MTSAFAGDSVSISASSEKTQKDFDKRSNSLTTLNYIHTFDNQFGLGVQYNFSQKPVTDAVKSLAEINGYYTYKFNNDLSFRAGVGIGERFQSFTTRGTGNFPYYAVYGNADYKLTDKLTWNAISYRYRDSFDTIYNFKSHQYGTGLTYALTDTISVNGKVYQNADKDFKPTAKAVSVGLAVKF
jgi:hypothetical protein